MATMITFLRRLGEKAGQQCQAGYNCPQILEKTDGDFVVIGALITDEVANTLPPGPGIGPKEGAVNVPRAIMVAARPEIPVAV